MKTALDDALDDLVGQGPPPAESLTTPDQARPTPGPRPAGPTPVTGLVQVRLEDLHPDPENPREQLGDIAALADSIREQGLIQPIVARQSPTGLVIVAGHRRYVAVQRLGWISVEVIVRRDMAADDVLAKMLVENGQRAGLDPIEEARALKRLKVQKGCSDADLARTVGYSQATVSNRIALLSLPLEDQEQVRTGAMTRIEATHNARVIGGTTKPTGQDKGWHLGPQHPLAKAAKARCQRAEHKRGRTVGGMACGACWESVIRADERQHAHETAARRHECPTCGAPTTTTETTR